MLPMMPGAAMASSDSKTPPLRYKVFTVTRWPKPRCTAR
jgi:hypothetical protein